MKRGDGKSLPETSPFSCPLKEGLGEYGRGNDRGRDSIEGGLIQGRADRGRGEEFLCADRRRVVEYIFEFVLFILFLFSKKSFFFENKIK